MNWGNQVVNDNIWSVAHYKNSLIGFIEAGYEVGSFEQFLEKKSERFVILRHDIDFNPILLEKMLEVEEEIGVNSSSFFRVCAKNYNILSFDMFKFLSEIQVKGHEVGLHLDIDMTSSELKTKIEFSSFQKDIFEKVSGRKIAGFSLHYPATNQEYSFADYLMEIWRTDYHTYNDQFFNNFKYLSDSGGRWREGHFSEWMNKSNRIQVLTHPIWHYRDNIQENF